MKHRLVTDTDPQEFNNRLTEELSTIKKVISIQFSTSYCPDDNKDTMQTCYSALILYKD